MRGIEFERAIIDRAAVFVNALQRVNTLRYLHVHRRIRRNSENESRGEQVVMCNVGPTENV